MIIALGLQFHAFTWASFRSKLVFQCVGASPVAGLDLQCSYSSSRTTVANLNLHSMRFQKDVTKWVPVPFRGMHPGWGDEIEPQSARPVTIPVMSQVQPLNLLTRCSCVSGIPCSALIAGAGTFHEILFFSRCRFHDTRVIVTRLPQVGAGHT